MKIKNYFSYYTPMYINIQKTPFGCLCSVGAPPRSSTPKNVAIESNFDGFLEHLVEAPRTGYIFMNRLSLWRVFGVLESISVALGGWGKTRQMRQSYERYLGRSSYTNLFYSH